MEFFSGMDETAICVVDDKGKVLLETTMVTDLEAIRLALKPYPGRLRRVGHEAGALSSWLHPEQLKLRLLAVCLETQHVRAALKARATRPTRPMRWGWRTSCGPVGSARRTSRVEPCYRLRMLLTH
jgi:transposase